MVEDYYRRKDIAVLSCDDIDQIYGNIPHTLPLRCNPLINLEVYIYVSSKLVLKDNRG